MKFIAVICLCFALIGVSLGLKHKHCGLPPAMNGDGVRMCLGYIPSFSYHVDDNSCKRFIYGGCGGNCNRFYSLKECEDECKE